MCPAVRLSTLPEAAQQQLPLVVSTGHPPAVAETHTRIAGYPHAAEAAASPRWHRLRTRLAIAQLVPPGSAATACVQNATFTSQASCPISCAISSLWRMRSAHRTVTRTLPGHCGSGDLENQAPAAMGAITRRASRPAAQSQRSTGSRPCPASGQDGQCVWRAGPLSAVPLGPLRWCHCAASRPGRIPPGACRDCSDRLAGCSG
jgi:hypothetical protein